MRQTYINFNLNAHYESIADRYQHTQQHNNRSLSLFKIGCVFVVAEDTLTETNYYFLEREEKLLAKLNPQKFIDDLAKEWAANEDDTRKELISWGLAEPEDYEVDEGYQGETIILVEGQYNDCWPVGYVYDDEHQEIYYDYCDDTPRIFSSVKAAQEWIDNADEEIYYLSNNEASRPKYIIIKP